MVYNLDFEFERHNIFFNNNKHTALLRSTAATSRNVAIAPVTTSRCSRSTGLPAIFHIGASQPLASFHFTIEPACCSTNRTTEHARPYLDRPSSCLTPIATTDSYPAVLAKPPRTLHHMLAHHMISALV